MGSTYSCAAGLQEKQAPASALPSGLQQLADYSTSNGSAPRSPDSCTLSAHGLPKPTSTLASTTQV